MRIKMYAGEKWLQKGIADGYVYMEVTPEILSVLAQYDLVCKDRGELRIKHSGIAYALRGALEEYLFRKAEVGNNVITIDNPAEVKAVLEAARREAERKAAEAEERQRRKQQEEEQLAREKEKARQLLADEIKDLREKITRLEGTCSHLRSQLSDLREQYDNLVAFVRDRGLEDDFVSWLLEEEAERRRDELVEQYFGGGG